MEIRKKREIDGEKLIGVLRELAEKTIVVEGKRDKRALKKLGLDRIIAINGRPLYRVVEDAARSGPEIVILTDFDEKGRKMHLKLKSMLQKYKKTANSRLRMRIMEFGKTKIEDFGNSRVEDIVFTQSLKEVDDYVKVSTDFNKVRYSRSDKRKGSNRKTRRDRSCFWAN
jgi:5S rRNA maturation endonuclease (ribonuclease M5)